MIDNLTFTTESNSEPSPPRLSVQDYAEWLEVMRPLINDQRAVQNQSALLSTPFVIED